MVTSPWSTPHVNDITLRNPTRRVPYRSGWLALSALGIVLVVVLIVSMRAPVKDDVAWLLYVAHKWMGGQKLYIDLIEINPPLIIWLSALPTILAQWLGTSPHEVAIPFFSMLILASAWWSAGLLRRLDPLYQNRVTVFAVTASVMLLTAGNELGQREHLLIAAALPFLCVVALSLQGQEPGRGVSLAAGMIAALGCLLKPRYGLAFAAVEMLAIARGLRPWRTTNLGAVAVTIAYVVAVLIVHPAYLERIVPLALKLYDVTDVRFSALLTESYPMLLGLGTLLMLTRQAMGARQPERWALAVLALFGLASGLVTFLDGKDWFYHRLPATIVATLGLVLWAAPRLASGLKFSHLRRMHLISITACLAIIFLTADIVHRTLPQIARAIDPDASTEKRLQRLLKREKAQSYLAFSEWIALGFPVVNNTNVTWTSRFDSMWALKGELWSNRLDPGGTRDYPVRTWVVHDFIVGCPDLVVIDTRQSLNYVGVLASFDSTFARAWSNYGQIAGFDGLRVYRRQSPSCTTLYTEEFPVETVE